MPRPRRGATRIRLSPPALCRYLRPVRISKKCEYALRALFAIARQPERQFSIGELARREGIPTKFLEQILLGLRHAGILQSKRGVGGGYGLRRPPGQIHVGEVIRAMDGPPVAPVPAAGHGPFATLMRELDAEINAVLESRTLEDILARAPAEDAAATLSFEI